MKSVTTAYKNYYDSGIPESWIARYRWVMENFIGNVCDLSILEIGSGNGGVIQLLKENNNVLGVDASETGIDFLRGLGIRGEVIDVSITPLPCENQSIDIVISLETFEHLTNPQFAINEIKRVLKKEGKLICSIPNPLTGHPYLYPGLFTYKNFCRFLNQNGFGIERKLGWGRSPLYSTWPKLLRIPLRILLTISEKTGTFLYYFYWLWTFSAINQDPFKQSDMIYKQAEATMPTIEKVNNQ